MSLSIYNILQKSQVFLKKYIFKAKIGYGFAKYIITKDNRRDHWRYGLSSKGAWQFLEIIYPYLVTKKERAKISIELGKRITKRIGYKVLKISKGYKSSKGSGISEEELNIREVLRLKLRELNRVGRNGMARIFNNL